MIVSETLRSPLHFVQGFGSGRHGKAGLSKSPNKKYEATSKESLHIFNFGLGFGGLITLGNMAVSLDVSGKCDVCQDCMIMLSTISCEQFH